MQKVLINIDVSQLDTQARKDKANRAAKNFDIIVNHPRFKEEVSKYKTSRVIAVLPLIMVKTYWRKFVESDELVLNQGIDYEIDLEIRDYYSWKSVVGYMVPGKKGTYVNTKFFDTYGDKRVLSNFFHEHTHHLGFYHRSGKHLRDSFPYFLNKVVEELYDELILRKQPEPEPQYRTYCNRRWFRLWTKKCWKVRIN